MRDAKPRRVSLQFLELSALLCRGVGDTRRYHETFKRAAGLRYCLRIGDHVLLGVTGSSRCSFGVEFPQLFRYFCSNPLARGKISDKIIKH